MTLNVLDESKRLQPYTYMESVWISFFAAPHKWFDCRMNKRNQNAPDFKCIDTGKGLWIESNKTPLWVKTKLSILRKESFGSSPTQDLWKVIFAKPSKWLCYRKTKKSNKYPDFVHKDTRKEMWIDDLRTPAWVRRKLNYIPDDMFAPSTSNEDLWKDLLSDPSKWCDRRKIKISSKSPDFVHKNSKEALWIEDFTTPAWVKPMLNNLPDEIFASNSSTENLWKMLFANPSKWSDYRKTKRNKRHPDFKHEDTCAALWVGDLRTPAWVKPMLNSLLDEVFAPNPSTENRWKDLLVNPSNWIDYRKFKHGNRFPDFKNKDTNETLWIESWVVPMLGNLPDESFAPFNEASTDSPSAEELWKSFFAKPINWFDNRDNKRNKNYPDFVRKHTWDALWIQNITTPAWVLQKLNDLTCLGTENLWRTFFADPSRWVDNRRNKKSPNSPDFIHRHTDKGLWIDSSSTPRWVTSKLNELQNDSFVHSDDVQESSWNALFADPSKWHDQRITKTNPKAPDFRHEDTHKGLWIDSKSTPAWVVLLLSKLGNEAFASSETVTTDKKTGISVC